ncbi:hypothetical protein [Deinococcus irradiatisoli]|uniref:hypothetical protein n=1 Tax=Deinococcus irradiatisoli TaxID=2202254 RepID=UPI0015E85435|nr:hypothetical protein [Deinococcus irradiatisoli]
MLVASYGLTTDNTLTVPLLDVISREDRGLIVREIGAALPPVQTSGLGAWAS